MKLKKMDAFLFIYTTTTTTINCYENINYCCFRRLWLVFVIYILSLKQCTYT